MHYYEVAANRIVRSGSDSFTYSHETPLPIGQVVTIELGKKTTTGVILAKVKKPTYIVKPILSIIEDQPLPLELIQTARWISKYYSTHLALTLQTILPRGLNKKRRNKQKPSHTPVRDRTNIVLNKYQLSAIKAIDSMSPGMALLHGVTGSGKTQVYIESAKKALTNGRSVIILVPEIALTSQLLDEFSAIFKDSVVVTHSQQTESERHLAWQEVLNSTAPQVIIGPRSALFMPIRNLGLIVIDEAHEPSFKQEQSPRYSALRVASILASEHKAKAVMGSATPSIADYYLANHANRPIIKLPKPARESATRSEISMIDMTKRSNFTRHRFLSNTLINNIKENLDSNHQVLIFHNRRGSASTTLCENCGWTSLCQRCFIPLTLHIDNHQLRCHICNNNQSIPTSCFECGHADIVHKGIGTKLIESEIRKLFPSHNIARFDGDNQSSESVDQKYGDLYNGTIDIIIGTQVIAKGLDLPRLRTVGIVQADAGLSLPDYGSSERTFQLIAQAIGRVGRSNHKTSVIVQSYQPDHPAVSLGVSQDYDKFYKLALAERKRALFPPFCHLLKLTCVYKTEKSAVSNSQKLSKILKSKIKPSTTILGPTPAFYERRHDTYRWQLVIKSSKRSDLVDLLEHLPPTHWQYELDPISLL